MPEPEIVGLRISGGPAPKPYRLLLVPKPNESLWEPVAVVYEGSERNCQRARKRLLADITRVPVLVGAAGQFGLALAAWLAEQPPEAPC